MMWLKGLSMAFQSLSKESRMVVVILICVFAVLGLLLVLGAPLIILMILIDKVI